MFGARRSVGPPGCLTSAAVARPGPCTAYWRALLVFTSFLNERLHNGLIHLKTGKLELKFRCCCWQCIEVGVDWIYKCSTKGNWLWNTYLNRQLKRVRPPLSRIWRELPHISAVCLFTRFPWPFNLAFISDLAIACIYPVIFYFTATYRIWLFRGLLLRSANTSSKFKYRLPIDEEKAVLLGPPVNRIFKPKCPNLHVCNAGDAWVKIRWGTVFTCLWL